MSILSRDILEAGLREAARIAAGFKPGEAELADAPLLIDWAAEPLFDCLARLVGQVRGHPLIQNGWTTTSPLLAADDNHSFTKIRLCMPDRVRQQNKHLLTAPVPIAHVVLDDRVAAGGPVLVTKPSNARLAVWRCLRGTERSPSSY